jgi:maleate isomerase
MFGWRARLGLMIPTNNTVIEPELALLTPSGVALYTTRMISSRSGYASVSGLQHIVSNVERATEELSITGVNAFLYGCLSTSFVHPDWEASYASHIRKRSKSPAITAMSATISAIRSFNTDDIALLCSYESEMLRLGLNRFAADKINVVSVHSLGISNFSTLSNITNIDIYRSARSMDLKEAKMLCILATDIPSVKIINTLEKDLVIPVISTNQSLLWNVLN